MFENIANFFKRFGKNDKENSSMAAKERLHLVLAQDRANISADFLEMMKQEIIDVIKKYIDIDEEAIDVRMTNKAGDDGIVGAPALYANIPIVTIKNEARKIEGTVINKNQEVSEVATKKEVKAQVQEIKIQKNSGESNVKNNIEKENTFNINTEEREKKIEEISVESVETSNQNTAKELKENLNNEKSKTKNTSNKKQGQKTASKAVNKKNSNTKNKNKNKKK